MTKTYRVYLVTAELDGSDVLIYGEAVDLAGEEPLPKGAVAISAGGINIQIFSATLAASDVALISAGLEGGKANWDGRPLKSGRLTQRARTIVPVVFGLGDDDGSTLHPDGRYTYAVDELWDTEEETVERLWATREFRAISDAIQQHVGISLRHVSDRIGNFLVFDRLSDWRIDSQCDVRAPERWVRAVADGTAVPNGLRLHVRMLDGYETVTEQVIDLPPEGVPIKASDYTQLSISLFDASGELLARCAGTVIGDPTVRSGAMRTGSVIDSKGTQHDVSWPPWPRGAHVSAIRPAKPWSGRAGLRAIRNLKQRERGSAFTYGHNSEATVNARLRDIVSEEIREFLYVWDPYLDPNAVLDVLQWSDPQVPCRILCGASNPTAPLVTALKTLRTTPWPRTVECKHRVERRGGKLRSLYHDRFIITKTAAWMLGSSLNSIGRAPGGMIRLYDPDPLRWMFEDEWVAPQPATVVETVL
jgi:hypothetical protein